MKPVYSLSVAPPHRTASVSIYLAVRIAKRYSTRLPTWQELRDEYGMSRATAFRWLAALRDA